MPGTLHRQRYECNVISLARGGGAWVEPTGTYARGMTVCELRHPKGSEEPSLRNRAKPNAKVAASAKNWELIHFVIDALLKYGG